MRYRAVRPQYTPLRRKCSVRCASKLSLLCIRQANVRLASFQRSLMQHGSIEDGFTNLRNLLDVRSMLVHQQRSPGTEICRGCLCSRIAFHLNDTWRDKTLPTKQRPAQNRSLQNSLRNWGERYARRKDAGGYATTITGIKPDT